MPNKNLYSGFNKESYFFFILERKGNSTLNELKEFVNLKKKREREKLKQIKRNSINYHNKYEKVKNIENYLNFLQKINNNYTQNNKENLNKQILKLSRKSINNKNNNYNNTKENINTIDKYFQINKVKNEKYNDKENKNKNKNIVNEINEKENKIPISYIIDKIEELKKEKIELPLPLKYKLLLRSFTELDSTINYFKTIKSSNTINFNRISNSIESSYKHRFNLDILKQILFIVPHFFIIKWVKNFENNDFDLLIDIPKDNEKRSKSFRQITKKDLLNKIFTKNFTPEYKILSNNILNQRKKTFTKILIEIVNLQHENFLKKNRIENYNPFLIGSWHKDFDIENLRDIPKFDIESKPEKINYYQNFIINNDIKKKLIEKALNNDKEIIEKKYSILEKYCSKNFINNLRKKEEAIKISNEILEFSQQYHKKQELTKSIPNLIIQIKSICLLYKKESWNVSELLSKLLTIKNINKFFNENNLLNYIRILMKLFPNWIKFIDHSYYGKMILIDLSIEIRKEIIPKIKLNDFLNL